MFINDFFESERYCPKLLACYFRDNQPHCVKDSPARRDLVDEILR
jgi:hypothetical protein